MRKLLLLAAIAALSSFCAGAQSLGISGAYYLQTTGAPTQSCSATSYSGVFAVSQALNLYQCSNNNVGATYAWNDLGGGGSVTWPASGDVVISNGTGSPTGIAEVDGDCLVGSSGSWMAGACGSGGSNLPDSTVTQGGGVFFGGDSPSYAGFDSTGCTGSSTICNSVGELVKAAYGGLGKVWPLEYPGYPSTPAGYSTWGDAFYEDCVNMQLLPQVANTDTSYVDTFMQCADGAWGGIGFGTITNFQAAYEASINVTAAWAGSLKYQQMWATNTASCVQSGSGSWTASDDFVSGVALTTTTPGAVLTCTTPYATADSVIGVYEVYSGGSATATYNIDGTVIDTWNSGAAGTISTTPGSTSFWWGDLEPLSSTPATHTYTITVTAAAGGNPFTVVMFSSPPTSQQWNGLNTSRVFIAGTQGCNGCGITGTQATYNAITATQVAALQAAGWMNVNFVNLWNAWPDDTIGFSGGTYPNGRVCPASTVGTPHPGDCFHLFWSWSDLMAAGKMPSMFGGTPLYPASVTGTGPVTVTANGARVNIACSNCADIGTDNAFSGQQKVIPSAPTNKALILQDSPGAAAVPAFVQGGNLRGGWTGTVTAGNAIVTVCGQGSATPTDSLSNTYTQIASFGGYYGGNISVASNTAGGSDTISNEGYNCVFAEVSGLGATATLDGSVVMATATGATSQATGSLTTNFANDLLLAGALENGSPGGTNPYPVSVSGFSNCEDNSVNYINAGFCELVEPTIGTYSATVGYGSGFSGYGNDVFLLALKAGTTSSQSADLQENQTTGGTVTSGVHAHGINFDEPMTFSDLTTLMTCGSGTKGSHAEVTDSTTNTFGGTITGSGSYPVAARCDGTNWVVF